MSNKRINKAYVRYDGSGRVIPGSLILNRFKPKVGNWQETPAYLCCNPAPPDTFNFDITANWSLTTPAVVDDASFKTFLESGQDGGGNSNNQTGVVVTDFLLEGNRLRCNVSSTGGDELHLSSSDVTDVTSFGNLNITNYLNLNTNNITSVDSTVWPIGITYIELGTNSITSFDNVVWPSGLTKLEIYDNPFTSFNPSTALPNGLLELAIGTSTLTTFNPSIALPSTLQMLSLSNSSITSFNPSIALPSGLEGLDLTNNQITSFDPSLPLPSSLLELQLSNNNIVTFNPTTPLPSSLLILNILDNQIVIFNPSLALPIGLSSLGLSDNQMTTAGYTGSEPWANAMTVIPSRGGIYFNDNIDSVSGTNLETILIAKGWTVIA
jgi:hypothetical protein